MYVKYPFYRTAKLVFKIKKPGQEVCFYPAVAKLKFQHLILKGG